MGQFIEVLGGDVIGVKAAQGGQVEEDVSGVVTQQTDGTWHIQWVLQANALQQRQPY